MVAPSMWVWWLLLSIPLVLSAKLTVPGCPDVDVLESQKEINQETLNNLLLCFCQVNADEKVSISCLYGSNPQHLQRAADAVRNTSFTIEKISTQHMEFSDSPFPSLGEMAPALESLEIRECGTPEALLIPEHALKGLEQSLRNLTVHGCSLTEVPPSISILEALETLDLSSNKLATVPKAVFQNKKKLQYLDLSANGINYIEEGTFAPLESLETIAFGERNYINETLLEELARIPSLKTLDLSRADGIFEPPTSIFGSLPELELLKLSGCSIENLEAGTFAQLKNLKQLDLRVNLIENISAYAFDGLANLERLTLAGNYIRTLDNEIWTGLEKLQEIDLGWNEIHEISPEAFAHLSKSLTILNLRHNPMHELPRTGLAGLKTLSLAECELKQLNTDSFAEYTQLQSLDLSRCNLSHLPADIFKPLNHLEKINLAKNKLRTLDGQILKDMTSLEEIDISGNPFLCDSEITDFIFGVEDRYREAAKEGKNFLYANGNETLCDRPYGLRGQSLLEVDTHQLQPYDEMMDTTTMPSTTTEGEETGSESSTPFTFPEIFVGSENNDTLFKEEPRRDVYDLNKFDNPKNGKPGGKYVVPITIALIAVISIIALIAVGLFMKKKRKVGVACESSNKKTASIEDGMVDIELDARPKQ